MVINHVLTGMILPRPPEMNECPFFKGTIKRKVHSLPVPSFFRGELLSFSGVYTSESLTVSLLKRDRDRKGKDPLPVRSFFRGKNLIPGVSTSSFSGKKNLDYIIMNNKNEHMAAVALKLVSNHCY